MVDSEGVGAWWVGCHQAGRAGWWGQHSANAKKGTISRSDIETTMWGPEQKPEVFICGFFRGQYLETIQAVYFEARRQQREVSKEAALERVGLP